MTGNGTKRGFLVMAVNDGGLPPIIAQNKKKFHAGRTFKPENLLARTGRQKSGITSSNIPDIAGLDPDGDILHHPARPWRGPGS